MGRVVLALLGLLALTLALVMVWARAELHEPLDIGPGTVFEVPAGSALSSVADRLAAEDYLDHPVVLTWYGRVTGAANRIKAGEYELEPGITAAGLLEHLVAGDVRHYDVTIIEGWTAAEAIRSLQSHHAVETTIPPDDRQALLDALEASESHPEGLFFPETYRFPKGTKDIDILRQAYDLMQRRLTEAWSARADDLPLESPYEALILASIIEKETARDDERRAIAGVFIRRLQRGMRLQTDPTVIYGLGESFDGNIRRQDLRNDTPYNTYTRKGLPPTPIALPGDASLRAAVDPADGDELFFVATGEGDGSHFFSATREEHEVAVRRYLSTLRERRRN